MLRGATLLGYDAIPEDEAHEMRAPLKSFWGEMRAKKKLDPWFEIFSDTQLGDALAAIQKLLTANPPSPYSVPTIESLQSLLGMLRQQVPPVGFSIDEAGNPVCTAVDFRHIIFAVWIASKENSLLEFDLVNRLCEHAIMQQGAIDVLLGEEL